METFSALLVLCVGNSSVPVNSQHKGQWRGALMFSLICARINDWVNNRLTLAFLSYQFISFSSDMEIYCSTMSALNKWRNSFKQGPSYQVMIFAILPFHRHCWAYLSYAKKMLINQTNFFHILSFPQKRAKHILVTNRTENGVFIQGSPLRTDDRHFKFKTTFMFSQTLQCVRCLTEIKIGWWWYSKKAINSCVSNKTGNCASIQDS